jgi:hypothetical protein
VIKREYQEYEKQLKEFLLYGKIPENIDKRAKIDVEYTGLVLEYLEKHGISKEELRRRLENLHISERVVIRLVPFSIDRRIVEEFIDEDIRKRIEKEIENVRKEIVEVIKSKVKDIVEKLRKLAETEIKKEMLKSISTEIEEIMNEARSLGITEGLEVLESLKERISSEDKLRELVKEIKSDDRVKALLSF